MKSNKHYKRRRGETSGESGEIFRQYTAGLYGLHASFTRPLDTKQSTYEHNSRGYTSLQYNETPSVLLS